MTLALRHRLLTTTLLVGAGMAATPVIAQTVAPTDGSPTSTANPTGPSEAQPVPSVAATGKPVEQAADIVVTGSRIASPNLTSSAPITVVSSQDIKLSGTTKVEDLLNSLPSVGASQNSTQSNGSDGTATVDLRSLGAKRTLVLINGRRLMPGDPNTGGAADLNVLPSSLIKRVEVLTGGASSTYGADAVAGVVNFIMDTNFTGIRFDGQYSTYQHRNSNPVVSSLNGQPVRVDDLLLARTNAGVPGFGFPKHSVTDGGTFDGTVSIGAGFNDNRGHAVVYFGYRKTKPVVQANRDYSVCQIQANDPGAFTPSAPLRCGGSATSFPGNALFFTGGTSSTIGSFGPGTITPGAANRYNFAPANYFQRPDERYTAGLFANYEINSAIKPYLEFMFMDDRSVAQIGAGGDFGDTNTINCDNPLLSAQQRTTICNSGNLINGFLGAFPLAAGAGYNPNPGAAPINFFDPLGQQYNQAYLQILRRNVEGGPRITDLHHTNFRGVLGTRGDLGKSWSYDAYYQYGRTSLESTQTGNFSVSRLRRALNVTRDTRAGSATLGQPICRSLLDGSDPNCVPLDLFTGAGISAAAQTYLATPSLLIGSTSEQVASANITGRLGDYGFKSPWAESGIDINIGAEYRREALELRPDAGLIAADIAGNGAPTLPINGSYNVKEIFGEVAIPLVQNGFFYDLSLSGGYRHSSYKISNGGSFKTNTYKLAAEFAPVRDIRFRGAYNRAVRAPNIQELFATQFVGLDGGTDPCAGHAITATEFGCIAQGLRVGQTTPTNPAAQYNGLLGGLPTLTPEVASTKTFGVVLQPSFIPRFALTVDYFDIKVKKAIQSFGADAILAQCGTGSTSATVTDPSCALIHRNPAGSLWLSSDGFVRDLPQNIGSLRTTGYEFNGSYSQPMPWQLGNLSASFVGTLLKKYRTDNGLTSVYDCVGYYGQTCSGASIASSAPLPKWRHKLRLTLQTPVGIGISGQWRHLSSVKEDFLNPISPPGGLGYSNLSTFKAQNYFDLAMTYTLGNHFNFRVGVNNIFDRNPPLTNNGSSQQGQSPCPTGPCNGNTYPGTYDALGRLLYAGVTLNF